MAEITDYRNYYLLSRSWQGNLLAGKIIEKFGGIASQPVYFCQMIDLVEFELNHVVGKSLAPDSQLCHLYAR